MIHYEKDDTGIAIDKAAKDYMLSNGTTYTNALKHVLRESRQYSAQNGPWSLPEESNPPPGIVEAYRSLANVAANAGHSAEEVARQINAIFDGVTINRAAQFVVERRKDQIVGNLTPGKTDANLSRAYDLVKTELPATWAIYSGRGIMTAEAAREMLNVSAILCVKQVDYYHCGMKRSAKRIAN